MKVPQKKFLFAITLLLFFVFSCKKTEILSTSQNAENYYPVSAGRVWIYRLDSTNIPAFGTSLVTTSYHLKDSVGNSFMDNTGHESWIVYRLITDTLEQNPWLSLSSYYVTPTKTDVEVMDDNNLRFVKLATPVRNGFSWQGNNFIDTRSANSPYQYLDGWNYTYQNVDAPYTTLAGVIDSSATVFQIDETDPDTTFDPQYYQQRNYSIEVYAKNVGLIYKNFLHWTWQPTPEPARFADGSYGIILNLIRTR